MTPSSMGCPVCNDTKTETVGSAPGDYTLKLCLGCGLRFSDPMKGEGHYSPIYERRIALILSGPQAALKRAAQGWNFQMALRALGTTHRRLLDIGCGTGQFLALARSRGHQVTGLDFHPDALRVARDTFGLTDLFCGLPEEFRATGRSFHAVTALEVLEHTTHPVDFLRQAASLLDPGGALYVSVPSFERWPRIFDPEADIPPHHLTLWTSRALTQAFERAGLRPVSVIRSPLLGDDLMRNVNLRLQRRVFTGRDAPLGRAKSAAASLAWKAYTRLAGTTARELVRLSFHLPAALLRLHPGAGGFGLFAVAVKPDLE